MRTFLRSCKLHIILCVYAHTQSCPTLCEPMDYIACQAPVSMEFSRQEYWSGLSFPSPRDLPYPGIKSMSLALAGGFFTTEPPGTQPIYTHTHTYKYITLIINNVYLSVH